MTPALLLPGALTALAALAIPLLIHISRRTESRTIDFAALRWLEAKTKPRRRPRLDEIPLLLLRMLLLALLALWLAKPVLWGVEDRRPIAAIAPGVTLEQARALSPDGARLVWLAPGFPAATGGQPRTDAGVVSLVRQLDAETPPGVELTYILPPVLDGVDAERPRLTRRVAWRVAENAAPVRPSPVARPPALTVRHDANASGGVRYFRAAAIAWAEPGVAPLFDVQTTEALVGRTAQHLIWLSAAPLPAQVQSWSRDGGTVLIDHATPVPADGARAVVWRNPVGEPLAEAMPFGAGRLIRLTRPLTPAGNPALVEPTFPEVLARLLTAPPEPARVRAVDHAPLTGVAPYPQPPLDLRPWLALLIGLTFFAERWLATTPRRAVAP
ncbi:MAG TPA: BatA domain-containing protein [Brevundimonas sp.]|nr:BatA domain-containing protein [Brevundimonas sp.]